jgi:BlaI family penicillinase repressor
MTKRKRTRRGATDRPTEAELEILEVLWAEGPCALGAIHAVLKLRNAVGYTTTQKLVHVMRDKGLVTVDKSTRPPSYVAADPPEETQLKLLDYLAQRAFGGSAKNVVMSLLSNERLSASELDEVRKVIAEKKKGKQV